MIKAILFDGDGIVIKKQMVFSQRFSRDFSVPMDDILPFFKNEFQSCLVGKSDLKQAIEPYLAKWKWTKSVDELLQYWFENENHTDARIIETIAKYRKAGIKCYIQSNQEKYRSDFIKDIMGLGNLVDGVFSSAYMGVKKPDLGFWQIILDSIGFNKEEVLVWDDDEKNIESAKKFGLKAELYTDYDSFNEKIKSYLNEHKNK